MYISEKQMKTMDFAFQKGDKVRLKDGRVGTLTKVKRDKDGHVTDIGFRREREGKSAVTTTFGLKTFMGREPVRVDEADGKNAVPTERPAAKYAVGDKVQFVGGPPGLFTITAVEWADVEWRYTINGKMYLKRDLEPAPDDLKIDDDPATQFVLFLLGRQVGQHGKIFRVERYDPPLVPVDMAYKMLWRVHMENCPYIGPLTAALWRSTPLHFVRLFGSDGFVVALTDKSTPNNVPSYDKLVGLLEKTGQRPAPQTDTAPAELPKIKSTQNGLSGVRRWLGKLGLHIAIDEKGLERVTGTDTFIVRLVAQENAEKFLSHPALDILWQSYPLPSDGGFMRCICFAFNHSAPDFVSGNRPQVDHWEGESGTWHIHANGKGALRGSWRTAYPSMLQIEGGHHFASKQTPTPVCDLTLPPFVMPPAMKQLKPVIFTWGYAGRSPDDLEALMRQHNAVLLDVRLSPRSRRPEWNSRALGRRFGSRYLHVGQWGNVNYKSDGAIELRDWDGGIQQLKYAFGRFHPPPTTAILFCGCRDEHTCHRHVIAVKLRQMGYDVTEVKQADPQAADAYREAVEAAAQERIAESNVRVMAAMRKKAESIAAERQEQQEQPTLIVEGSTS